LKQFKKVPNGNETRNIWKELDAEAGPIEIDVEYAVDAGDVDNGTSTARGAAVNIGADFDTDNDRNRWFDLVDTHSGDDLAPPVFVDGEVDPRIATPAGQGQGHDNGQQVSNGTTVHYRQQQQQQRANGFRNQTAPNGTSHQSQPQQPWPRTHLDEEVRTCERLQNYSLRIIKFDLAAHALYTYVQNLSISNGTFSLL
jgi:hypothetical protein